MLKTSKQISQEMTAKIKAAKTKEEREALSQIACGVLELLVRKCAVSPELMDETIAEVSAYVRERKVRAIFSKLVGLN